MTRMSPDARRQTIVEAAQAVARRKGLSATTVRDVAEEMGTSSGLIHHYFASMDQLLAEVFSQVAEADLSATRERMDGATSETGRLAAYFDAWADPDNDDIFQFWLDAWSEASRNEAVQERSRALNIEWQGLLSEVIETGIASGEFNQVDAEAVSWTALSLLDGMSLQVVAHPTVIERGKAAQWAANSTERDLGLPLGTLRAASVIA
ncbi:MAG: TetR family transcriptional regulator C-terminal domain-containing protein [Acidobacteria bacterium]|nr:TetR family transcriptional regulator C-terminal domain-containing protein [Acidobacteriota bacterium]